MSEHRGLLHNMSAPPRSKLVIAPHRRSAVLLTFQLSLKKEDWLIELLDQCQVDSVEELQKQAEKRLFEFNIPSAMSIIDTPASVVDDPLLTVAILSRCVGNLFLLRRKMELSYDRLTKSVTISDRRVIQQIVGMGEK